METMHYLSSWSDCNELNLPRVYTSRSFGVSLEFILRVFKHYGKLSRRDRISAYYWKRLRMDATESSDTGTYPS